MAIDPPRKDEHDDSDVDVRDRVGASDIAEDHRAGRDAGPGAPVAITAHVGQALSSDADLPVVARLVIEIRSDGRRTVARGALEDVATQQRVAVEARADSPLQLAVALARSLTQLPRLTARQALRGFLGRGKRDPER